MIPLRFLRCWNGFDRGAEIPISHPGLAEDLVRMGIAEWVHPAATAPTPVASAATDQTAPVAPKTKKK